MEGDAKKGIDRSCLGLELSQPFKVVRGRSLPTPVLCGRGVDDFKS